MKVYALVDKDMRVLKNKGKSGLFLSLDMLKKHAFRYGLHGGRMAEGKQVVELKVDKIYDLEESK